MGSKRKWKMIAECVVTVGLTVLFLHCSAQLLEGRKSDEKYQSFFEQEEDFDVLFIGNSHMKYSVFPMELWNDYGIVSYNMAVEAQVLPADYWQMKNVLDYTDPDLIVIDCYYLSETDKVYSHMHTAFDSIPLSRTKIDAIIDLLDGEKTDLTYLEFLWNYSFYHNRWNELGEKDFGRRDENTKGAGYIIEIATGNDMIKIPKEDKLQQDTRGVEYLEKMIEECQERGIEVLLTYLPFPAWEEAQKEANRVYDIAAEYGVEYINFLELDLINYKTDCSDDQHINLSGGRKVTEYLGQYIIDHYDVADHRNNAAYENWHEDYRNYRDNMVNGLYSYTSLDYYLLYLYDKEYLTFIEINSPEIWSDYYADLFENLGICKDNIGENTDFLVVHNAGRHVDYLENFQEYEGELVSEAGKIEIFTSESGTYGVYLDGSELYVIESEQNSNPDIRIVVVDANTKEVLDQSSFYRKKDAPRLYGKE